MLAWYYLAGRWPVRLVIDLFAELYIVHCKHVLSFFEAILTRTFGMHCSYDASWEIAFIVLTLQYFLDYIIKLFKT